MGPFIPIFTKGSHNLSQASDLKGRSQDVSFLVILCNIGNKEKSIRYALAMISCIQVHTHCNSNHLHEKSAASFYRNSKFYLFFFY